MTAPIMSPEAAAWIRANAWTAQMREMDDSYPDGRGCFLYRISPCEMRRCGACDMGRCDRCICQGETSGDPRWPLRWDSHVTLDGRAILRLYAVESQRCAGWVCTCACRNPAAEPAESLPLAAGPPPLTEERACRRHELARLQGEQLDIFAEAT
ncbi:DUF6248 family natural product biosynthesis protein [Actinomadura sp. 3N407]|uniref:DUF6248 family natural product biosynthesis protein n=1 Tax=Actinomadura sp. 3N407 TaxID=3457423 RepID=UPI003FCC7CB9